MPESPRRIVIPSPRKVPSISPRKHPSKNKSPVGIPNPGYFPQTDVGFTLVGDREARNPSREEFRLLLDLFPTSTGVSVAPPLLIVSYRVLPPKPWPLSVAGIPVFITLEEHSLGFGFGRQGGHAKGLVNFDSRCGVNNELFRAAMDYFEIQLNVAITSIVNLAGRWIVTVPDNTPLSELPWVLAHTPCSYVFASEEATPHEAAVRERKPNGTTWDESCYDDLRPGVMVDSGADDEGHELLTTSGVSVKDPQGTRFFTVASHGFPNHNTVYHPDRNGKVIGSIDRRTNSGIALAKLAPGAQYSNEIFTAEINGEAIPSLEIRGTRPGIDVPNYTPVSMNNPYSGHHDGLQIGIGMMKVPSDETAVYYEWVGTHWCYYGNGVEPMEGSCGSPVVDEDGNIISIFRSLSEKYPGCGFGVSASVLDDAGYHL